MNTAWSDTEVYDHAHWQWWSWKPRFLPVVVNDMVTTAHETRADQAWTPSKSQSVESEPAYS
jgi:hypothetical protein